MAWIKNRPVALLIAVCVAELLLSLYLQATITRFEDIVNHLVTAQRILHGSKLYQDILSIDVPMPFYLRMPGVWLAEQMSANILTVAVLFDNLMAALCAVLVLHILRKTPFGQGWRLFFVAALLIYALFLLPFFDNAMGQKDYYFFLCTLPYFVLAAAAAEGASYPPGLRICIGAFSVLGFGQKPFFIFPLFLVELYLCVRVRNWRSLLRPEALACAACGLGYLAWALPMYWPVLPINSYYYYWHHSYTVTAEYYATHLTEFLLPILVLWGYTWQKKLSHRFFFNVWLLAFAGYVLSYVGQLKTWGFEYHLLPFLAMGLLTMAIGCLILQANVTPRFVLQAAYLILISLILYTAVLTGRGILDYSSRQPHRLEKLQHLMNIMHTQSKADGGIYVLGMLLGPISPEGITEYGLPWDYHFYDLWLRMGIASYRATHQDLPAQELARRVQPAAKLLRRTETDDVNRIQPTVIVVSHEYNKFFLGYLLSYKPFAQAMSNYEFKETYRGLDIYIRKHP